MANIAQPQRQIHYISELKKIFVGRNNQPVTQKFKIDTNISDDYYFQIVNKNNQIVSLAGRSFKVYGSYIDAKRQIHILFFTESFSIEDNVLHFHLNTNTNEYNEYITTEYKEIQFTIIETTGANTQVALRDVALAYRRPYIDQDTQVEIVYRDILTGITVPLTGSFGVGENINLFPGANSFAFGEGLITQSENQTVFGQYNEPDAEQLLIFGNGSDDNNRNNIFTVDKYGNAYLSGARVLNNFDRTNVSQLNNDIGYITLAEVPVYEAGTGLKKSGTTFSLSATIPSAVSQLVNDTGFITGYTAGSGISIDDGVINCTVQGGGGGGATYTAGDGIGISEQNVISLTATIPSAVSQLTNDVGYITHETLTGYNYVNGYYNFTTQNYGLKYNGTVVNVSWLPNDAGYITNTALANYAQISAIPTSTSQLTNDSQYMSYSTFSMYGGNGISVTRDYENDDWIISWVYGDIIVGYGLSSYVDEYAYLHLGVNEATLTGFAATSAIPTGVSQLTNDTGLLSSLDVYDSTNNLYSGKKLKFGSEFTLYYTQSDTIEIDPNDMLYINVTVGSESLGYQRSLTFSDDFTYNYGYGTIELNQSANQQKVLVDNTVQGSGFVLGYNKDYDIFYNKISTNNGLLTLNVISGFENDIEVGKVATFEHWIKPEGSLTGVSLGSDLNLVGELPSSYSANNTQVFTRRVIRLNSQTTVQQISYAYQFLEPPTPLTFKAVSGATEVALVKGGNPYPVTLEYSVNKGSWSSYTIGDTINLASGDIVSFRGNNDHFNVDDDNRYTFTFNNRVEGYGNVQSLLGFDKTTFDDGVFASLFNGCTNLQIAPNVFTTGTAGSNCMARMFWGCSNLKKGPIIGDVYLSGNSAMNRMFRECTSLTAVQLKFNSWGADDYNSYAWIMDVDNPTSYSSGGLIIIPQGFSYSRGNYAGMPESYNWIILNRIDGQLYYAENEDGHSQGDLFTGTDPFAE